MATTTSMIQNLFEIAQPLLGRTTDNNELKSLLIMLGHWPLPIFQSDEFIVYLEKKDMGYCLQFDDADTVKSPVAIGRPPRTPLFVACFFFSEGADEYHAFPGNLPLGLKWSDSAKSAVEKLGEPKFVINNKKTNALSAHSWDLESWSLSVKYKDGGRILRHVHAGIILQP